MAPELWVVLVFLAAFAILSFLFLFVFARVFRLWMQAFLAGAHISAPTILLMCFRRSPVKEIVQAKIMAAQSGVNIPLGKLESAALQGVDIERAVLAVIRARETGTEVSWEEIISTDREERLREKLFPDVESGEN